jgi:hypothetical protein
MSGELESASRCDKCGEIVADIDAGFSPGSHEYGHECGGTWRRVLWDRESGAWEPVEGEE